jgi:O-antigen biosynthesis protein
MDRNKIVVVLGMHRSGTSVVARGLEVLGISLGDNLYPPAVDNPKGFWEDRDILGINEELLARIGSGSERLGLLDWKMPKSSEITSIGDRGEKVIREKCAQYRFWGFKDPRTARLLPFWQPIFDRVGCDVCYVIALRNPLSVVQSLSDRNGLGKEKSLYLWLEHLLPAISMTTTSKRVVVDYDKLLDNPQVQLVRVALMLGLPAPESLSLAAYEKEFLESGLRHARYTRQDLDRTPDLPTQVIPAYELLVKLADSNGDLEDAGIQPVLEALIDQLKNNAPGYWSVTLEDQVSAIKVRERIISERDEAIQAQARLIEDGMAGMSAMEKMIRERDEAIQAQTRLIDDGMAGMSAMEKMIRERDEAIQAQTRLIDDGMAGMSAMEKMIHERDETIRDQAKLVDDVSVRIRELQQTAGKYDEVLSGKELEISRIKGNFFVRALMLLGLIK